MKKMRMKGGLMKTLISRVILLIIVLSISVYLSDGYGKKKAPSIRALILKTGKKVTISGGEILFKAKSFKKSIKKGRSMSIKAAQDGKILVSDLIVKGPVLITAIKGRVRVNGKPYRGKLFVYSRGNNLQKLSLLVVNSLDMEQYLAGIINSEISSSWPKESIKAQAIAARTYALRKARVNARKLYDVHSTTLDQVYGGSALEDAPSRAAVKATRGIVIRYKGKLIEAFYHSSCGGRTADAGEVWGNDIPYLKSIVCSYCQDAPKYFWRVSIPKEDLTLRLNKSGMKLDKLKMIKVIKSTQSGRARVVVIDGGGIKAKLSGEKLRRKLGYDRLFSAFFHVAIEGEDAVFRGRGAGHGIGMCQWGAKGLAMKGKSYISILKFYYKGVELKKIY